MINEIMKFAVLFSGGKDSCYATYLAKKKGNEIMCLISIFSKNKASYMYHTPSISEVKKQAKAMNLPIVIQETKGEKEKELKDLKKAIEKAKRRYKLQGIVTGALYSNYQKSPIQKICIELKLKCVNPLWHKDEEKYLNELIENNFKIIITGVAAFPLDSSWLGRTIDKKFIDDVQVLNKKYKIHPAGEGGEFETFVLDCPLFNHPLKLNGKKISGKDNSWQMQIKVG